MPGLSQIEDGLVSISGALIYCSLFLQLFVEMSAVYIVNHFVEWVTSRLSPVWKPGIVRELKSCQGVRETYDVRKIVQVEAVGFASHYRHLLQCDLIRNIVFSDCKEWHSCYLKIHHITSHASW